MKKANRIFAGLMFFIALVSVLSTSRAKNEEEKPDVVTIVTLEDLPEAAAKAIQDATGEAVIKRLEKSEVKNEIKMKGETGLLVKLETLLMTGHHEPYSICIFS